MSTLETPPELADNGYWYVLPAVPDPVHGGQTPGAVPGDGWCAWYSGTHAAIRCPDPVVGLASVDEATAEQVLVAAGYGSRPYGRIGGR